MIEMSVEWTDRSVQTDELMWKNIKAVLRWNTSRTKNEQQKFFTIFMNKEEWTAQLDIWMYHATFNLKFYVFASKRKTAFVLFVKQSILTVNWEYFRDLFSMFQTHTHLYCEHSAINFTSQVLDSFKSNKQCRGIRNIEFDFMISA